MLLSNQKFAPLTSILAAKSDRNRMRPSTIYPLVRLFLIVHITTYTVIMAGKKGENTKKAAGNAKVGPPSRSVSVEMEKQKTKEKKG